MPSFLDSECVACLNQACTRLWRVAGAHYHCAGSLVFDRGVVVFTEWEDRNFQADTAAVATALGPPVRSSGGAAASSGKGRNTRARRSAKSLANYQYPIMLHEERKQTTYCDESKMLHDSNES